METQFEEIAREAITLAEVVECSLPEFRDGLKAMIQVLSERLEQVQAECGGD